MSLRIKRKDGSVVEIHDGAMRLKAQIQVFGKADVPAPKTGKTFQVELLADGALVEATPPSVH